MRLGPLLECAVLGCLLVLGALSERTRDGLTLVYLGFACIFAGSFFRRLLVARGRLGALPARFVGAELLSFTGVFVRPIGIWSHALISMLALHLATVPAGGSESAARATRLEELAVALV